MDTGYVQLLDRRRSAREVLDRTKAIVGGGRFVAGAFVADGPGDAVRPRRATRRELRRDRAARRDAGGLPVARAQRARRRRGSRRTPRSAPTSTASSASSSARCSCRTAGSTRSTRTRRCSASRSASAPSTRRCSRQAEWDRLALRDERPARLPRAHRQRPRHRHGDVRLRLPARPVDVRARRVRPARPRVGRGRSRASTS